ncbi:MAG: TetR/AcrR family transcriptional regulator [Anaerolineales bacterium]|jgi:AcrR family transcriptional regulator
MDSEDRRVVRTRRLLKQALLELIGEKEFDQITIRDITDRADIGYATYFRHYEGKDDLMLGIFEEIVQGLESQPETRLYNYFEEEGYRLFEHVRENHLLYKGILESRLFTRKLKTQLNEMVRNHLDDHRGQVSEKIVPFEIAANHMVSSLLGLVEWWISNEMPYSVERMAVVYERLIIGATWYAIESENPIRLP